MPNHVTNILKAAPKIIAALLSEDEEGKRFVDFNNVLPTPPDNDPSFTAEKTEYPNGMVGWSVDGLSPLDWARHNWGTKWNAYDQVVDDRTDRVRFSTAWSHPVPVVEALSKMFPDEAVHVIFADEDFGYNLGAYVMVNGEIVQQSQISEGSDEANEMAAMVLYEKPYADVKEEWEKDSIEDAQHYLFCRQIEEERGVENGYSVIHEEGLEIPDEIKAQVQTIEDAEAVYV